MKTSDLIYALGQFFTIDELVCPHLLAKHGKNAWSFLDFSLLSVIFTLRQTILKNKMVGNTYKSKGTFSQRGYRCNLCQLVSSATTHNKLYTSAHPLGKALDFFNPGWSAENTRQLIIANKVLLPCHIRLETNINWVHIDTLCFDESVLIEFFHG